ncbi:MAG TPA: SRPBCC family protein, partial [Burkholderiaceae bacterium]|nr:SRPBCC family protein [Burkholderiaceae bacterium]
EIIEAVTPSRVVMRLAFTKPFATTNRVEFTLQPQGASTHVTWAMTGPMPYLSKLICTFVSMDKMVGPDFEAGLANLKAAAEKG